MFPEPRMSRLRSELLRDLEHRSDGPVRQPVDRNVGRRVGHGAGQAGMSHSLRAPQEDSATTDAAAPCTARGEGAPLAPRPRAASGGTGIFPETPDRLVRLLGGVWRDPARLPPLSEPAQLAWLATEGGHPV
jgi:hypothetical protein